MNRKAVLKNPTFLDTIYRRYIVWIDIYSRSFESIPNFRNDKLLFLQIVIDGYRLLIKFNPLILQILECTYFYRSVRDARKICFKPKNHRALYTYTCVIHVFVKAIRLLKYLDGSRRTNWFVNRLLNLVYLVILFTTFLSTIHSDGCSRPVHPLDGRLVPFPRVIYDDVSRGATGHEKTPPQHEVGLRGWIDFLNVPFPGSLYRPYVTYRSDRLVEEIGRVVQPCR